MTFAQVDKAQRNRQFAGPSGTLAMAANRSTKSPRSPQAELTVVLGRLVKFNLANDLWNTEGSLGASGEKKKREAVLYLLFPRKTKIERLWNVVGVLFKLEECGCVR